MLELQTLKNKEIVFSGQLKNLSSTLDGSCHSSGVTAILSGWQGG